MLKNKINIKSEIRLYASHFCHCSSSPISNTKDVIISKDNAINFINEMITYDYIKNDLYQINKKDNGDQLLTLFIDIMIFKTFISNMTSLPKEMNDFLSAWQESGANEVSIDFLKLK